MRSSLAIMIFSIAVVGCGSSYMVSSSSNGERLSFSEFNAAVENEKAEIVFQDSTSLHVQQVRAEPDSTSWLDPIIGARDAVPTYKIKKIILTNKTRGFLEGAGIGFLSGGAPGLLAAVGYVAASPHDEFAGIAYVAFPAMGGGAGLLSGIIVGAINGHTYEYEFVIEFEKPSD